LLQVLVGSAEVGVVRLEHIDLGPGRALADDIVVDHVEADGEPDAHSVHVEHRRRRPRRVLALDEADEIRGEHAVEPTVRYVLAERNRVALVVQRRRVLTPAFHSSEELKYWSPR
jgi:hypothetical protein